MNAPLGGVLAAVTWGSADFIARFTGGAVGHVNALFGMLATSAVLLTGLVFLMDLSIAESTAGWWLLLIMGGGLTLATLLLYQGLVRGPVTIVAPIAGTFPAFNILLALALGVRPAAVEWAAMSAVMMGVLVVARSARHYEARGHYTRAQLRVTVMISLAASFSFAVTVAAGQEAGAIYGEVQAVFLGRWISLAFCILLLAARREVPRIPMRWWPALGAQGVLDGSALVALVAGSQGAGSAVTAVLASTFSVVTVVLARIFIREAMSWGQWLGIAMVLVGVASLSGLRA
jgi:drug/metabolite transporter (DMT)-like permease